MERKKIFGGRDDHARAKKKKFPVFAEIIIIGVTSPTPTSLLAKTFGRKTNLQL